MGPRVLIKRIWYKSAMLSVAAVLRGLAARQRQSLKMHGNILQDTRHEKRPRSNEPLKYYVVISGA